MARKPKIKLTEPQYAFLCELVKGPRPAVETFRPASKLVELGFATRVKRSFNWEHTITEAGLAHHKSVHMADKICGRCETAPWTCRLCTRKTCEHYCTGKKNDGSAVCGRHR